VPLLALLCLAAGAAAAPSPAREVRGLWVVRTALVSPQAVDEVVDAASEAGFNTLFVQVRGRGDAFYDSRLVPRSGLLAGQPRAFDPLARLLERAATRGLEVHAWVNVLLSASLQASLPADNVVAQHPEWVMVPRAAARTSLPADPKGLLWLVRQASVGDPDIEGFYLSPSSEGARRHLEDVVREIVRQYPVKGVHLDFIRYPGPEYDYSVAALEGFRRRRGDCDLLAGPAAHPGAWADYRRAVLTELAYGLARTARVARPDLVVSAAVVPDEATALYHKYQDWPTWLSRGILDAVCPMAYTPDSRLFRDQVKAAEARLWPGQAVWAGIGAFRLSPEGIVEKIETAREAGASGVVVFSHETLSVPVVKLLAMEAFQRH